LIIIAGRNKLLKQRLDESHWKEPMKSYGFVTDMPRLMSAADVLVTKAGPATISEACIAGLPMILYDAIPGQETGNVDYVVENKAGVYAPSPREVADALALWLSEGTAGIARRAANAKALGRPDAVWDIADEAWKLAHHELIPTHRRNPWRTFTEQTRRIRTVRDLTDMADRYVKKY
jgi:1,2-diacylglycerol 3-beta-galactosyltransferase